MIWLLMLLLVIPVAQGAEESRELYFQGKPVLYSVQSYELPVSQLLITTEYEGYATIRLTTASTLDIEELLFKTVTLRSSLEEYATDLVLTIRVLDKFLKDNNLAPEDIVVLQNGMSIPLAYTGYIGSYHHYNLTPEFGELAIIARPLDEVTIGSFNSKTAPGENVTIPIRIDNKGSEELVYVLSAQDADFGRVTFEDERPHVGGDRQETIDLTLAIDDQASIGVHSFIISIYSVSKSWTYPVAIDVRKRVVSHAPETVLTSAPSSIPSQGGSFQLFLRNPGEEPERFVISASAPWASITLSTPSVLILGAGEERTVQLLVQPHAGSGGEQVIELGVKAGEASVLSSSIPVTVIAPDESGSKIWMISGIILVLFLLMIVLRTFFRGNNLRHIDHRRRE